MLYLTTPKNKWLLSYLTPEALELGFWPWSGLRRFADSSGQLSATCRIKIEIQNFFPHQILWLLYHDLGQNPSRQRIFVSRFRFLRDCDISSSFDTWKVTLVPVYDASKNWLIFMKIPEKYNSRKFSRGIETRKKLWAQNTEIQKSFIICAQNSKLSGFFWRK